jgi:threonine dehydrogenase-like Zn-dependent dehydrogenase
MTRVCVDGPGRWRLAGPAEPDVEPPGSGTPGDVGDMPIDLAVVALGICGTDMSVLAGTNPLARYPLVLGHECLARVVAGAAGDIGPGDDVIVFPTLSCGACGACRAGQQNRCPTMAVLGLSHPYGCFRDTIRLPARQLVRVPADLARDVGPLLEPLAVAAHVLRRAAAEPGERGVVIGVGALGLSIALAARARGIADVGLVDRWATRQQIVAATGLGELVVAEPGAGDTALLTDRFGGVDLVVDTVSTTASANAGLALLRPGGRYVAVGSPHGAEPLAADYGLLYGRELSIIAARNYTRRDFIDGLALAADPRVDPAPMITGRYPLADFGRAVAELAERPERHVKILLHPDGR